MEAIEPDFTPVHSDHAIESITFALSINRPISGSDVEKLFAHHSEIHEELPAATGADNTPPSAEFAYCRPDGSAVWLLRCAGSEITIHCTRYTRWNNAWPQARKYFHYALNCCSLNSNGVAYGSPSLHVVDLFVASKPSYDLYALLRKDP